MMGPRSPRLDDVLHDLGRSVDALGNHMSATVLTGGLAVFLYRWCMPNAQVSQPPLMTYDIDWAVPEQFVPPYDVGIDSKLKEAGFVASLSGSHQNPVTHYHLQRHKTQYLAPIYLEFIAPRQGSKRDRRGKNQGIIEIEPGLHAQTDPYLGLLLVENFTVDASKIPSLGVAESRLIRLANPACLVVQKVLIRKRREPHKRANDAAHIYDVALTTRPIWHTLAETLTRIENSGSFPKRWFKEARRLLTDVFATPQAAGPVEVARIYRDAMSEATAPSEDAVYRVVAAFLKSLGLRRT